jgi:hypothetical protein
MACAPGRVRGRHAERARWLACRPRACTRWRLGRPAGAAGWPALPLAGWTTDGPRSVSRRSVVAPPPPPDGRGRWRAAAAMLRMHLPASANSGSVLRQPRHLPERPQARRRQKAAPRGTQERATKHGKNGPVGGLRAGDAAGWPRGCFRWITALTAAARPPGLPAWGALRPGSVVPCSPGVIEGHAGRIAGLPVVVNRRGQAASGVSVRRLGHTAGADATSGRRRQLPCPWRGAAAREG